MSIEVTPDLIRQHIESTLGPGAASLDETAALKVARSIVEDILADQANETRMKAERRARIVNAIKAVDSVNVSIPRIAPGDVQKTAQEIESATIRHGAAVEAHEARIRQNGQRILALVGTIGTAVATGGTSVAITAAVTELAGIVLAYANGSEAGE